MAESAQLMRQWRILQILSHRKQGVTLQELSQETEVSSRTISRDLTLLKTVGFPISEVTSTHGKKQWKIARDVGIAQLQFTLEETAALYLGRQFLELMAGTLFWQGSHSAYQKIKSALSGPAVRFLEKLASAVHLTNHHIVNYAERAELIDQLMLGIEDHRLTVITYQSLRSTEPVTLYDIHPYALIFHKGALYLIAWSLDHGAIRTFKVDRISEVDVQPKLMSFQRPKDFHPAKYLEHSFGIFTEERAPQSIRIRFAPKVVRILQEKKFHSSQRLIQKRDGSVIAEYQLTGFEEIRPWILSFGRHARVLEPVELVEMIRDELDLMINVYTLGDRTYD
ncbi:HTH domain protein [Gimesia panareensis]|uniref:HTH domain protein n=1 Tax=Gimesia panareensis TaxID=2527978 RepID=A0A518FT36_9PLAN|nr:WYL domain-containing protein [Gimesia panareensis]QDV19511.1 HTH domain protein [Gimesia panareensis]